jgi:hypothetical protein
VDAWFTFSIVTLQSTPNIGYPAMRGFMGTAPRSVPHDNLPGRWASSIDFNRSIGKFLES